MYINLLHINIFFNLQETVSSHILMCAICSSPDVSSHIVCGSYFVDVVNGFVVFVHIYIPINTIQ